jgi:hypothetical protein
MASTASAAFEERWLTQPTFVSDDEDRGKFYVCDGVMVLQFRDADSRKLVIPLENVDFIDRFRRHLTFHMKSGTRHAMHIGVAWDESIKPEGRQTPILLSTWVASEFAKFSVRKRGIQRDVV